MSEDGVQFGCYTPDDIGCQYSLGGSDQVYRVDTASDEKVTILFLFGHFNTIFVDNK